MYGPPGVDLRLQPGSAMPCNLEQRASQDLQRFIQSLGFKVKLKAQVKVHKKQPQWRFLHWFWAIHLLILGGVQDQGANSVSQRFSQMVAQVISAGQSRHTNK